MFYLFLLNKYKINEKEISPTSRIKINGEHYQMYFYTYYEIMVYFAFLNVIRMYDHFSRVTIIGGTQN